MDFYIMTIFPEMILDGMNHSIIKRAIDKSLISINPIDIREFSLNKHKKVDDYSYGGGCGMIMQAQPIFDAYNNIKSKVKENTRVVYLTPRGKVFNQKMAFELSKEQELIFLCGHYEGIDERVIEEIVTDEVSIGDFILTGGELPTMVIIDSISRLISGVLSKEDSFLDESFSNNLLEYPQYTRPIEFLGKKVPDVLLSGNHNEIKKWRENKSIEITKSNRIDLYNKYLEERKVR